MENLFNTLGESEVKDLLATGKSSAVAISVEPGNGTIPYGTVLYRKSGVLYAPAAAGQMDGSKELVILKDNVDTTTNAGIAVAAAAYEEGVFKAGTVKISDGNGGYTAVNAAQALVLRQQNITFRPFDDWSGNDVEADNLVALDVTVTAGTGGTATADKATAKKGETVTLTITPGSGKEVDEITVTAGGVTVDSNNKFVMGDKAVTITVSFKDEA